MQQIMAFMSGLPTPLLYGVIALVAAVENVFPPLPSDLIIAFAVFSGPREAESAFLALVIAWVSNVSGATFTYALGRRYGSGGFEARMERYAGADAHARLVRMHERYGLLAMLFARFIPGVRALVPPFAGAMRLPPLPVIGSVMAAAAIWYTLLVYVSYTAGSSWQLLTAQIASYGRAFTVVAVILLAAGLIVWRLRARRSVP